MRPAVRLLNRRVHIYTGLALLLFVMLFAATGMILNRHWEFTEFWEKRRVSVAERTFEVPLHAKGDIAAARELLARLGLKGEVATTKISADGRFTVQAQRPGENLKVEADLAAGRATVERTKLDGWGVVRSLHTFVGVSRNEPERRRDWWLTGLWSLAVDLTAAGLVLLVIGGLVEAWAANPHRLPMVLTFVAGTLACLAFICGLVA